MATSTHGMNVEEVQRLGADLQAKAEEIRQVVSRINGLVQGVTWVGPDASRFKDQWWPGHQSRLSAVAGDLHGFGQSALNNASEQLDASGGASTGGGGRSVPGSPVPGNPVPGGPAQPGGGSLPGAGRTEAEVIAAYRDNYLKYGLWADGAPGGENEYQCVSWAWFRMKELGYEGPQISGNGGFVAGNLGGTADTVPQAGSVISTPGNNHVMIAEEVSVNPDGSMTVRYSEMNSGEDGSGWRQANANEYRDTKTLTRHADGTWSDGRQVIVANPEYGTPRI